MPSNTKENNSVSKKTNTNGVHSNALTIKVYEKQLWECVQKKNVQLKNMCSDLKE